MICDGIDLRWTCRFTSVITRYFRWSLGFSVLPGIFHSHPGPVVSRTEDGGCLMQGCIFSHPEPFFFPGKQPFSALNSSPPIFSHSRKKYVILEGGQKLSSPGGPYTTVHCAQVYEFSSDEIMREIWTFLDRI